MPESRRDIDFFDDILDGIRRVLDYSAGLTKEIFLSDNKTQDAVIRNLEVIGEATKRLTMEFRDSYPQIPWREMAALRDRLIHDYFGINTEILWEIVHQDLPDVLPTLLNIRQTFAA